MQCPPEIRNIIYDYLLSFEHRLIRKASNTGESLLAFLQTSKAIEREAAPIFYGRNVFHFVCPDADTPDDQLNETCYSTAIEAKSTLRYITLPTRHLSAVKSLSVVKYFRGYWPNRPSSPDQLTQLWLAESGKPHFEVLIEWLVSSNVNLKSLSIELKMQGTVGYIECDWDPSYLFMILCSSQQSISIVLSKLQGLKCLRMWKTRIAWAEKVSGWVDLENSGWNHIPTEILEQAQGQHFPRANAVHYTRTKKRLEDLENPHWEFSEGFSVDLV